MPRSYPDAATAARRKFALAVILACSELMAASPRGQDARRGAIPRLSDDQLGESLKRFRSLHKNTVCTARPMPWSDDRSFRKNWLLWIDCSLESTSPFVGTRLLAETNPRAPLGTFASFRKKRLVELSYTLAGTLIDDLLPALGGRYGRPDRIAYNRMGRVDFASWISRNAVLDAELIPIAAATADRNFLRIGEGTPANAVRVRLQIKSMPALEP